MTSHFEKVADYVMSNDGSELSMVKAERDYALHCLEREIAIGEQDRARIEALEAELFNPCTQAELDAFEDLDSKSKRLFRMWVDRAQKAEARIEALKSALVDICELVDGYEDVNDGQPNLAMRVMTTAVAALEPDK